MLYTSLAFNIIKSKLKKGETSKTANLKSGSQVCTMQQFKLEDFLKKGPQDWFEDNDYMVNSKC